MPGTLHTVIDAKQPAPTPFPVPASTSPGIDNGPSLTSAPQIGQRPPVSSGGDASANSADSGFSDVLDVVSAAIPTPSGKQQGITASTIGGLVNMSIPNGPVPLTSALPPGEIGISNIASPTTTAVSTTDFTSIPSSVISGYVVPFVLSPHTSDHCMSGVSKIDFSGHGHHDDDDDRPKTTSLFTITTDIVSYSPAEISGTQTSIPITLKTTTVLSTVVPFHSHRLPNTRLATPNSGLAQLNDDMPLTVLL